ncbi:MAG: thioredoxin [Halobacteriaceae archaeon]
MSDTDDIEALREERRQELLDATDESPDSTGDDTPDEPIHVEANLQETVSQHPVVLLEFYADWCGPCQMLEPVLESIAAGTDAAVVKVDVDQAQQLASQYQVRGVPTLMVFDDGEVVERMTGARDQETLERLVEQYAA